MNKYIAAFSAGMLALGLASTAAAATPADTLIYNGNFEQGPAVAPGGYTTINGPSYDIPSWRVDGTSIDIILGNYGAISGRSIDLLGTPGPGTISTSFYGNAGQNYTLSFDLFRNGSTGITDVTFNGQTQRFTAGDTVATYSMYTFAPTSGPYALSFSSVTGSNGDLRSGAVIDNVTVLVSAVPEPSTWAMLIGGLAIVSLRIRKMKMREGNLSV